MTGSFLFLRVCQRVCVGLLPTCRTAMTSHKRGTPRVIPTVFPGDGTRRPAAALRRPLLLADGRRQLEAGPDPELLIGAAEGALDCLLGQEQCLRDLAVRVPLGRLGA